MKNKLCNGGIAPSYICHKILEGPENGPYIIVKDTTTNMSGQEVKDIEKYINSNERVCIRTKPAITKGFAFSRNEYNFDISKDIKDILIEDGIYERGTLSVP